MHFFSSPKKKIIHKNQERNKKYYKKLGKIL